MSWLPFNDKSLNFHPWKSRTPFAIRRTTLHSIGKLHSPHPYHENVLIDVLCRRALLLYIFSLGVGTVTTEKQIPLLRYCGSTRVRKSKRRIICSSHAAVTNPSIIPTCHTCVYYYLFINRIFSLYHLHTFSPISHLGCRVELQRIFQVIRLSSFSKEPPSPLPIKKREPMMF